MDKDVEINALLNSFGSVLDKEYFSVDAGDRDAIARLVMVKELWKLNIDQRMIPEYKEYLSTRVKDFELVENYEAADFYKRMIKQIKLI